MFERSAKEKIVISQTLDLYFKLIILNNIYQMILKIIIKKEEEEEEEEN